MKNSINGMGIHNEPSDDSMGTPLIPSEVTLPEITVRAIVLGTLLTILLAAANAYLGLKVGTTVSASIPAAVISMGILRFFRNANALENTMVQTMASVGETLTAGIAFILPAFLILHLWDHFHYWQTVGVSLLGGGLGVLFTIPLRRALLSDRTLRYPEGVAIGQVLRASVHHKQGELRFLTGGGVVGAGMALCQSGLQVLADHYQYWVATSRLVFGFNIGLSPALIAAGYIVGINVALSLLVGVGIGWLMGIPLVSFVTGLPVADSPTHMATMIWGAHIRYMGVGTMLVGGLWTVCALIKPVVQSIAVSLHSLQHLHLGRIIAVPRVERDLSIRFVLVAVFVLLIPLFLMMIKVIPIDVQINNEFRGLIAGFSTVYILVGGFIFCSVMAYFAGLIGSTNSPVSGLLVSALLILCLLLILFFNLLPSEEAHQSDRSLLGIMVAIGSTVVMGAALSISNDTMQDLKVGHLVGATPWKQQLMLIVGVIVSAFIIPPILQLLYTAYGIGGIFPRPHMNPAQMLAAPQAGLMASVAQGAFHHTLNWTMIGIGAGIAVGCIIIDEKLKQIGTRLPVLAVGLGIYLPLESSVPFIIGGLLADRVQRRLHRDHHDQPTIQAHHYRGLLLVCGIVAGASLMGVLLAIPFALKESADALKIMPARYVPLSGLLGVLAALALCRWIYHVVVRERASSCIGQDSPL